MNGPQSAGRETAGDPLDGGSDQSASTGGGESGPAPARGAGGGMRARMYVRTHSHARSLFLPTDHPSMHPALTRDVRILSCTVITQHAQAVQGPHVEGGSLSDPIQNKTETAPL